MSTKLTQDMLSHIKTCDMLNNARIKSDLKKMFDVEVSQTTLRLVRKAGWHLGEYRKLCADKKWLQKRVANTSMGEDMLMNRRVLLYSISVFTIGIVSAIYSVLSK